MIGFMPRISRSAWYSIFSDDQSNQRSSSVKMSSKTLLSTRIFTDYPRVSFMISAVESLPSPRPRILAINLAPLPDGFSDLLPRR